MNSYVLWWYVNISSIMTCLYVLQVLHILSDIWIHRDAIFARFRGSLTRSSSDIGRPCFSRFCDPLPRHHGCRGSESYHMMEDASLGFQMQQIQKSQIDSRELSKSNPKPHSHLQCDPLYRQVLRNFFPPEKRSPWPPSNNSERWIHNNISYRPTWPQALRNSLSRKTLPVGIFYHREEMDIAQFQQWDWQAEDLWIGIANGSYASLN